MYVLTSAERDAGIVAWTIQTLPVMSVLRNQAPGKERRGTSVALPPAAQGGIHLSGKTPINPMLEKLQRKAKAKRKAKSDDAKDKAKDASK